jgi:RimJ/RimL family protein N-acetyltransferase
MTEAVCGFTEYVFESFDICRVFAGVFESNPASARVLEKSGYLFEGRMRKSVLKNGQMLDQLLYARVLDED